MEEVTRKVFHSSGRLKPQSRPCKICIVTVESHPGKEGKLILCGCFEDPQKKKKKPGSRVNIIKQCTSWEYLSYRLPFYVKCMDLFMQNLNLISVYNKILVTFTEIKLHYKIDLNHQSGTYLMQGRLQLIKRLHELL